MRRLKEKMRQLDPWLLVPYLLLCAIGIVMVYSASAAIRMQTGGSPTAYLLKQTIYVLLGVSEFERLSRRAAPGLFGLGPVREFDLCEGFWGGR